MSKTLIVIQRPEYDVEEVEVLKVSDDGTVLTKDGADYHMGVDAFKSRREALEALPVYLERKLQALDACYQSSMLYVKQRMAQISKTPL